MTQRIVERRDPGKARTVGILGARSLSAGDHVSGGGEHHNAQWPAADHVDVLLEKRTDDDVLQHYGETGVEVSVCGRDSKGVAEPKLPPRFLARVSGQLGAAGDNHSAKDVAPEMHAPFEAAGEALGDTRLSGARYAGDQHEYVPVGQHHVLHKGILGS